MAVSGLAAQSSAVKRSHVILRAVTWGRRIAFFAQFDRLDHFCGESRLLVAIAAIRPTPMPCQCQGAAFQPDVLSFLFDFNSVRGRLLPAMG